MRYATAAMDQGDSEGAELTDERCEMLIEGLEGEARDGGCSDHVGAYRTWVTRFDTMWEEQKRREAESEAPRADSPRSRLIRDSSAQFRIRALRIAYHLTRLLSLLARDFVRSIRSASVRHCSLATRNLAPHREGETKKNTSTIFKCYVAVALFMRYSL